MSIIQTARALSTAILIAAFASACSDEPRVDASSPESMKASISRMRDSLPSEKREELSNAILSILISKGTQSGNESPLANLTAIAAMGDPKRLVEVAGASIDGMTADEILETSRGLKRERMAAQLSRVEEDKRSLEEEIALARNQMNEAQQRLAGVKISNARFYWNDDRYMAKPVIAFTIKNETETPIARVYCHGLLESPGRSIPWVSDGFNYAFRGGLEPGETQKLDLAPNMFGDWGAAETKGQRGLILTVTVTDFEGPDGKRVVAIDPDKLKKMEERLASLNEDEAKLRAELGIPSPTN